MLVTLHPRVDVFRDRRAHGGEHCRDGAGGRDCIGQARVGHDGERRTRLDARVTRSTATMAQAPIESLSPRGDVGVQLGREPRAGGRTRQAAPPAQAHPRPPRLSLRGRDRVHRGQPVLTGAAVATRNVLGAIGISRASARARVASWLDACGEVGRRRTRRADVPTRRFTVTEIDAVVCWAPARKPDIQASRRCHPAQHQN